MRKITTNDLLKIGAKVQFKGKRGIVKSSIWSKDQFGGRICLHEIEVQEHAKSKLKLSRKMSTIWEPVRPDVEPVNYSFIIAL